MNDPMTMLKADHREAKKLLTALGESEEGPERDKMAAELEYDRNAASISHHALRRFSEASPGWNGWSSTSWKNV